MVPGVHGIDDRFHGNARLQRVQCNESHDPGLCPKPGLDLKGTGIRGNVLSPVFANQAPLERVSNPDETAAVALFLGADNSSFMTGSEVFVDGGLAQV
jgi:NAD(P)-dependent dehydrogenase (short-subunit alcohol dehydrogenase family)